ncbi:O-antigen ligase family protein [Vibrio methylphosphonaticus]|uniref:O-antigen ligase family protein n=1 Tax=Vibrio methylphosphonaticus TaxID=2946866 RepID=UPI002029FA77|nr:O-antigen ligase family protein [Vibrio methylphosphonaticus]MCL9775464.1 O-antigen ligase family protein [Vibrio methylphosphonaticus]
MNYMTYGYWMLTSALVFSLLYIMHDDRVMLVLAVLAGVFIVFFGSRFASVCFVFGSFALYIYMKGITKIAVVTIIAVLVTTSVIAINLENVLLFILSITELFDLQPTSLYRLLKMVSSDSLAISTGRDSLYTISLEVIKNNPFGVGVYGYYKDLLQGNFGLFRYPHNIFIQLVLEFGIFGGVGIIISIIMLIYFNLKYIEPSSGWLFVLLLMINTKLLVTGSYLWEMSFWMFIVIGATNIMVYKKERRQRI